MSEEAAGNSPEAFWQAHFLDLFLHLLQTQVPVVLPRLGTFVLLPQAAQRQGQTWLPPSQKLQFSSEAWPEHKDLIIGYLAQRLHWSYKKTSQQLITWAENHQKNLQSKGVSAWSPLGCFCLDQEGQIRFEVEDPELYNVWHLGLPSLEAQALRRWNPQTSTPPPMVQESKAKTGRWTQILAIWASLSATLALIGALWQWSPWKDKTPPPNLEALATLQEPPAPLGRDSSQQNQSQEKDSLNKQLDTLTLSPPPPPPSPKPKTQISAKDLPGYTIILGVYQLERNAKYQFKELQARGYAVYMDTSASGSFRVALRLNCPEAELGSRLREIQAQVHPQAWVLR